MHGRSARWGASCALLTMFATAGASAQQTRACQPRALPSLGGLVVVSDINDNGQIVGAGTLNPLDGRNWHGVLWSGGKATDLGMFAPDKRTVPIAINLQGVVVGNAGTVADGTWGDTSATLLFPVVYEEGKWRRLPLEPGRDDVRAKAVDINDRGQIVGHYLDGGGCLLWESASAPPVRLPIGPGTCRAERINNHGDIAASVRLDMVSSSPAYQVGVFRNGTFTAAEMPDTPPFDLVVSGFNDQGTLVGHGYFDYWSRPNPFVWTPERGGGALSLIMKATLALDDTGTAALGTNPDHIAPSHLLLRDREGKLTDRGVLDGSWVDDGGRGTRNPLNAYTHGSFALNNRRQIAWTRTETNVLSVLLGPSGVASSKGFTCTL